MIGAPHEGSGLHPHEAEVQGGLLQPGEIAGGIIALDRQAAAVGLQVLADGQQVDPAVAQNA